MKTTMQAFILILLASLLTPTQAAVQSPLNTKPGPRVKNQKNSHFIPIDTRPLFNIPVTYNSKVRTWINKFQGGGKRWFKTWLEKSGRYLPLMKGVLQKRNLPTDLSYIAMIESGFSAKAISSASAVGYWQFMGPTATRYGLKVNWWIDERRDFRKSTVAAAKYLGDLYNMFGSWYLTAAAYNMGEGRLRRLIAKHNTKNFWVLSKYRDFPKETRAYIPKLLASIMIAKSPRLYGFKNIDFKKPYRYEYFAVPGGTDLHNLARYLKVEPSDILKLNPDLLKGLVPGFVKQHKIRIPKGWTQKVSTYIRATL